MLGFWGTAGRIFSLRQGKRLFGLVDAGQIVGVIISSYAVPVILSFHVKTKDILLISSVSVVIALIFQILVSYNTNALSVKAVKTVEKANDSSFRSLLKIPFVRLMSFFVALSMITAFFVSYSFLAVTKYKYPDMNDMAKFLGVFVGTIMFFTLLIKTIVYSRFMKAYGLSTSLIISPAVLIILSVIAVIIGLIGGYTSAAAGFIFFFLIMALSRLFSVALKSSIEAPSFKILYQTVDSSIRHNVQARVDGTINEMSALFSGVLLFILGSLSFVKLINFTEVLVIILAAWLFVAYKLYKAYKNNLDESLVKLKEIEDHTEGRTITGIASKALKGNEDYSKVLFVLNLQEKLQPILYEQLIPFLVNHKIEKIQKYALEQIASLKIYESLDTLEFINNTELIDESKKIAQQLSSELNLGHEIEKLVTLSRSKITSDRQLAARLIGETRNIEYAGYLKILLRDFDQNVKISSIKAAAKLKSPELNQIIAEFLTTDNYGRYAFDSLVESGESAIECLEHIFNKSGTENTLVYKIVRIVGSIGGEKACNSLINKINYHNRSVSHISAKSLLSLKYKVNDDNYYLFHQALTKAMNDEAWNIAARLSLKEAKADELLMEAINDEVHAGYDKIFTLLSLAYDAQTISHVRQNIESESAESTGYAMELLELVISDDLKPILFPIIDDTSDSEKVTILQNFFPVDRTPLIDLLFDIINRDYNQIGTWAKACALNVILNFESFEITDDLVAQLFNDDELLSELAALVISKFGNDKLKLYYKRLNEKARVRLTRSLEYYKNDQNKLVFNKIIYLKGIQLLKSVSGDILHFLASQLTEVKFNDNDEIDSVDEDLNIVIYFLVNGQLKTMNTIETGVLYDKNSILGGLFSSGYPNQLPSFKAIGDTYCYKINQDNFDRLIFDYPEFAESLIYFNPKETV